MIDLNICKQLIRLSKYITFYLALYRKYLISPALEEDLGIFHDLGIGKDCLERSLNTQIIKII